MSMVKIHEYTSKEPMVRPNAFIVEADKELVLVDTTLTMSDSKAFKKMAEDLGKPIAAILLTHGHPDHVAGEYNLAPNGEVPIYALQSIKDLMAASEASKHKQWSALFKEEWIPKWVYPNKIVKDGETVTLAGLKFKVVDLGAGGDCDANALWLLEDDKSAAFVGDFIYNKHHSYMMDGSVLRWLGNLERFEELLAQYKKLYLGHGPSGDSSLIAQQKEYFLTAAALLLNETNGSATLTDESKKAYEKAMVEKYPNYGFQLTVAFSADALAKELVGKKNYNW